MDSDRMLVQSVVRSIEVIGEAAVHVSQEFKEKHPKIPWAAIIAMRNRLIHACFDVDHDRVWDTVKVDLPDLIKKLKGIVPDMKDTA